jgi:hypothetical protein
VDTGRKPGGIARLRKLAKTYPVEVAADLRQFFGVSIDSLGRTTKWSEAQLLFAALIKMSESRLHAKLANWEYPVSREWALLRDIFDLQAAAQSKKRPKPYPAPWKQTTGKTMGKANQSRAHVLQQLQRMNSNLKV